MSFLDRFKRRQPPSSNTEVFRFSINGMHCVACALNIDSAIEDLPGVISSSTNYAKSITEVRGRAHEVSAAAVLSTIQNAGYSATLQSGSRD